MPLHNPFQLALGTGLGFLLLVRQWVMAETSPEYLENTQRASD